MLTHRASCKIPLLDQVALMESLLERILTDYPGPDSLRAFYWGRLAPDFTGCTDKSLRLALAAGQSPSWNRRSGKPFKGHPNHFVVITAEQQRIHSELADLFHRHGRQSSISAVEKVLVAKAASLLAYQGYGHRLDLDALRAITAFATGGLVPDLTFLPDIPAEEGLLRRKKHRGWNRLDAYNLEFHERVRQGYRALAQAEPQRWVTIDGCQSVEAIQHELQRLLAPRLASADRSPEASPSAPPTP